MYRPCLSPILGVRALTPPNRRSLGEPLPHQQADGAQVPPSAGSYALSLVQNTRLMRYYPTFRWTIPHQWADPYVLLSRSRLSSRSFTVPLACIKYAASVYPGPGSNPQLSGFYLELSSKKSWDQFQSLSNCQRAYMLQLFK